MPIPVKCTCGKKYQVADELLGKLIFCPNCKLSLDVSPPDLVPTVEEVEVLEEEEADDGERTYNVNGPVDDGMSSLAAAAAGGFGSTLGIIKTSKEAGCVAYSTANKYGLAGVGRDILILDPRTTKKIDRFEDHDEPVTTIAFAPNANHVFSGESRGDMVLWEIATRKVLRRFRGHRGSVLCCAVAPNGKYAISGGEDGTVRLWDFAAGKEIDLLDAEWPDPVTAVAYSHDGKLILAGTERGRIGLWSVRTGERLLKLKAEREAIEAVGFSYDDSMIVAAAFHKVSVNGIKAWRFLTRNGDPLPAFTNPSPANCGLYSLALTSNGQKIVSGADWNEVIAQTGTADGAGLYTAAVVGGLLGAAIYSAANSGGTATENRCGLQTFSVEGGVRGTKIPGVDRPIVELALSSDGTRALGALEDGDVAFFALPP